MAVPAIPITIITDSVAQRRDTYSITAAFSFPNTGEALTPETLTWTLADITGEIINSRQDESLTPASTVVVTMSGDDLDITAAEFDASGDFVTRCLFLEGTYDDPDLGLSGLSLSKEVRFSIYKGAEID